MAAPRVALEIGARNSAPASPSMTCADVPPETGYVKTKP